MQTVAEAEREQNLRGSIHQRLDEKTFDRDADNEAQDQVAIDAFRRQWLVVISRNIEFYKSSKPIPPAKRIREGWISS